MRDPVADFQLDQVRHAHPLWDLKREGLGRFTASDGLGHEVIGR